MRRNQGLVVLAAVAAISLGLAAWLLIAAPATEVQVVCKDAGAVTSYDLTATFTDRNDGFEIVHEVEGKMNRTTINGGPSGIGVDVYDGDITVYSKVPGATTYEKITKERFSEIRDISSLGFPYGSEHMCPDLDALGAKYEDTDEIGKRYRIDAEKDWEVFVLWIDDDGWLLRAEREELGIKVTVSGIGEKNEIAIPEPPYGKPGMPQGGS